MTDRISPWVISRDTDAEIAFLTAVLGAVEEPGSRVMNGDRVGHVEIRLGGLGILMFDAGAGWAATPAHLRVYVDDLHATLRAAEERGAVVVTVPTEMPFGDLVARFRDPQGHRWWIHQRLEEVPPAEMMRRFGEPRFLEAMAYVGDSLDAEMGARRTAG
jgi:uncharacterized glyoxalase superfamily protein PhnB